MLIRASSASDLNRTGERQPSTRRHSICFGLNVASSNGEPVANQHAPQVNNPRRLSDHEAQQVHQAAAPLLSSSNENNHSRLNDAEPQQPDLHDAGNVAPRQDDGAAANAAGLEQNEEVNSNSSDFKAQFLTRFTDLVQGNITNNPLTLAECVKLLTAMDSAGVLLLDDMALPEATNKWLAKSPTWLPILGLLVKLGHNVDYDLMMNLIDAIETKSFAYDTNLEYTGETLFMRCMLDLLETSNSEDPTKTYEQKIRLFQKLLETIAKIGADLQGHQDNAYWVLIIEDLAQGFKAISERYIHSMFEGNTRCFQWNHIDEVASNDPFQYFLWLLESLTTNVEDNQNNFAQRFNAFMKTFEEVWGAYFPNRSIVSVQVREGSGHAVHFVYSESQNRVYNPGAKTHNLTRASQLPWFKHVVGTLFPGQRTEELNDPKHSGLLEQYKAAQSELSSAQRLAWLQGAGIFGIFTTVGWATGEFLSRIFYPETPATEITLRTGRKSTEKSNVYFPSQYDTGKGNAFTKGVALGGGAVIGAAGAILEASNTPTLADLVAEQPGFAF